MNGKVGNSLGQSIFPSMRLVVFALFQVSFQRMLVLPHRGWRYPNTPILVVVSHAMLAQEIVVCATLFDLFQLMIKKEEDKVRDV